MWLAGSEAAQIYLGQTTVGVWSGSTDSGVRWAAAASAHEGWVRGLELLAELKSKLRRRRVVVLLSGALARPFIFEPVNGLRRWSEAQQVAAGVAPEATGLAGPCDVWLDDWRPEKRCIAVAVDRGLRESIENSARERKIRLGAIRPWWTVALDEAVREQSSAAQLLAVEEADALTLLCGRDSGFDSVASYAPRPDASQTEALLTRALLAADVAATEGLRAVLMAGPDAEVREAADTVMVPFGARLERLA